MFITQIYFHAVICLLETVAKLPLTVILRPKAEESLVWMRFFLASLVRMTFYHSPYLAERGASTDSTVTLTASPALVISVPDASPVTFTESIPKVMM